MHRTTVLLPEKLKTKANVKANTLGISLGEFIRLSIESSLKSQFSEKKNDPFIQDTNIFTKCSSTDCSINHDDYIYGDRK